MSNGKEYTVFYDDQFEPIVSKFKWYLARGYVRTKIYENGKGKSFSMHRLILGSIDSEKSTHHINKNPLDNRLANLLKLIPKEHIAFHPQKGKVNKGSFKKGKVNPKSKLTPEKVVEARRLHSEGKISMRKIAKMFGISKTPMIYAITGKTWKN